MISVRKKVTMTIFLSIEHADYNKMRVIHGKMAETAIFP